MPTDNLPANLPAVVLDTIRQHLPAGNSWIVPVTLAALVLIGLVFAFRGARLLPGIAALCVGGVGAALGSLLHSLPGAPEWLGIAAGGVVGLLLGVLLFRIWLALLVAACVIAVSLGVFTFHTLDGPIQNYLAPGLDRVHEKVTVAQTEAEAAARAVPAFAGLWEYLGTNVAGFQGNFYTIVFAAGLAGLFLGLLLPKLARSFWAATVGTGVLLVAVYEILRTHWSGGLAGFERWGVVAAAAFWGVSLIVNLTNLYGVRLRKKSAGPGSRPAKVA